jgi:chromosome segregation ATPase
MNEQLMLEQIKEFFRSFLAPQLEGVRGDIRALDSKIGAVDTKVESYRRELLSEFRRLEDNVNVRLGAINEKLDSRLGAMDQKLESRFGALESRFSAMDVKLGAVDQKIDLLRKEFDLFRKELLVEIRAAR